ncbi:MAG: lipoyl synthase [Bacteroidales bacterium]|nr:lipoyl synthase [Bacteroidales bacterium]
MEHTIKITERLPHWLKMKRAEGQDYSRIKNLVNSQNLHTICKSGNCPNIGECWNRGTATFMILGNICTRHCKFCAVPAGIPLPVDPGEPQRLAETIKVMKIRHCVITSVDRDDLKDLGASAWAATIRFIKEVNPGVTMEVLIPDFQGRKDLVQRVVDESPEIISHNLETVERLTRRIRSRAKYETSLEVLRYIASSRSTTKSGIMLGLGENEEEVLQTMDDLYSAGVQIMTLGQYLQPTRMHMPVYEYISPEMFEQYKNVGLQKGFAMVESSPLVRSSYGSEKHIRATDFSKNKT